MVAEESAQPQILIIGASGFIGQHLLEHFEKQNISIRAAARNPQNILSKASATHTVAMDLQKPDTIAKALEGIKVVYYLAHAMGYGGENFEKIEKEQAQNLVSLLNENQQLIYLGAITPQGELSAHLNSRKQVGELFKKSKCKTVEFKASIVVGKGSASFEMIRALVNRLPFVVVAPWSESLCQPIAIGDVIAYLAQAKDKKFRKKHLEIEIGGAQKLPYKDLLLEYAKSQGLMRPEVKIKQLPKAVALEVMRIVVPEYYTVGHKLLESIEAQTIADNELALKHFSIEPLDYRQSVALAKDSDLKEVNISEILQKLKNHSSIPQYLTGQTLQKVISYEKLEELEQIIEKIERKLPRKLKDLKKEEVSVAIPLVGRVKIALNEEEKLLYFGYQPKFFFQAASWAILDGLLKQL